MGDYDPCMNRGGRLLLVEGKDDCHVILALCSYYSVPETFGLVACDNADRVLKKFNALIVEPDGPEYIGIVLDADNDASITRWEQFKGKTIQHGYAVPLVPDPNGTIISKSGKPTIGLWIMPNNQEPGMLEDFLMHMANQEALSVACDCVEHARSRGVTKFIDSHHSKAVIHTYLAWQDEPGKPLGQSVTSHALQPETEISSSFVGWLKKMFCE